ncbi:GAF and ANTAR domain-containing protein [Pseudonocardia charpentierae]|uniref:GAF and ANTAR domain-containing protein n=1 Tax=Pseudonocardia charpentierae TaxID=3075545 RepID=A0ABU2NCE8_9PSEU|nr:GAF and ANTAR domain-containing protein [Pseudonocardia sp. DSM 45834]MDT0351633.1 GAF and ANTAR domain-containing protein [Pseudonocardia sp. DSM 45834]
MSHVQNDREALLMRAFIELADTLVDDYDVIDALDRLVGHSVELLSAAAAAIMLVDPRGQLRTVASSSEESDWTELMQIQADQGPCVDCVRTGEPVTVTDLDDAAGRWPELAVALAGKGSYRSVHALPLRLRGEAIGGLNLFHSRPGPLPEADLRLGQALADIATIGILQERAVRHGEIVTEQLQAALNSRVVLEQAKGVLAQQGRLTVDTAFDRLRRYARGHNLLLGEVARRVVTDRAFARHVLAVPVR